MAVQFAQKPAASSPASGSSMRLRFSGLSRAIHLPGNAPELSDALMRVLNGWTFAPEQTAARKDRADLCRVVSDGDGTFAVRSAFVKEPLERLPVASAICAIAADLAQGYFDERPGSLALHCGAFQIRNDLIALTGPARAGKSTLVARLAMEQGLRVFCDDVLPVDDAGFGVALGISPRIRIPLPTIISAPFRSFVDRCLGPVDDQYGYVVADSIAAHGSRAKLSAIVALRRRPRARARLHRLGAADAVQLIAEQNMADLMTARRAFERIGALVNRLQRFTLVYSDLDEAVDLIRRTFGTGSGYPDTDKTAPLRPRTAAPASGSCAVDVRRFLWKRAPGVQLRQIDGAAFLFRDEDKILWRMNNLASAVWAVLEEPSSIDEIVELMSEIFSTTPNPVLQSDLIRLFEMLAEATMIDEVAKAE